MGKCKFAPRWLFKKKVICELYRPNDVTCAVDGGGPFSDKGIAYCGKYNTLTILEANPNDSDVLQVLDEAEAEWVYLHKKALAVEA